MIDLTHGVPRDDVRAGALILQAARCPYLPVGVHLAVVDPDVGSERRAVALRDRRRPAVRGPRQRAAVAGSQRGGGVVEAVDIGRSPFAPRAGVGHVPRPRHLRSGGRAAGGRGRAGRGRRAVRPGRAGAAGAAPPGRSRTACCSPTPCTSTGSATSSSTRSGERVLGVGRVARSARGGLAARRGVAGRLRAHVRRRGPPASCSSTRTPTRRLAVAVNQGSAVRTARDLGRRRAADRAGVSALGHPRVHYRLIGSTNARARELAAAGAPHGTLVTAAEQTAGRGRQGRTWTAPAGPGAAVLGGDA